MLLRFAQGIERKVLSLVACTFNKFPNLGPKAPPYTLRTL